MRAVRIGRKLYICLWGFLRVRLIATSLKFESGLEKYFSVRISQNSGPSKFWGKKFLSPN